jgi:hypothetical protein
MLHSNNLVIGGVTENQVDQQLLCEQRWGMWAGMGLLSPCPALAAHPYPFFWQINKIIMSFSLVSKTDS